MPQVYLMQPEKFVIPVTAWYDGPAGRSKTELFGGVDTVLVDVDAEWDVHPRLQQLKCYEFGARDGAKPPLPDMTALDWTFGGDTKLDGRPAHAWRLQMKLGKDQVNDYLMYTAAADGAPLKLHMFGRNLIEDSHFDEYIYEFTTFVPFKSGTNAEVFKKPALCDAEASVGDAAAPVVSSLGVRVAALMPGTQAGRRQPGAHAVSDATAAYAHWWLVSGARPVVAASDEEHAQRVERFGEVARRVAAHNADPGRSYTMHLGRFADWSREEFLGTLMPDAWRRARGLPSRKDARHAQLRTSNPDALKPLGTFQRELEDHKLPKTVDWRGTPVDQGVKDQGYCGSCWSFAATGAMEAAWYLQTGDLRSFSEQQIVDCAWDWGVDGCDGGEAEAGINYIANNGGAALEVDYFYKGADDFCFANKYERVGMFDGYLAIKSRDEKALMEAVYRHGPVAVAVDASPDGFGFYKEGVFSDPSCSTTNLDHAVVLYGYGTTTRGTDYWLVKNSWSKLFGDDGFIKIERGKRDCGISTQASVAIVSPEAVREGAEERRAAALGQ